MSYRPPPPGSPGLPLTLYSGMSSLQIGQSGTGYGTQPTMHSTASHPQKALLKAPKVDHAPRHRRSEHSGSSGPWKDPRQMAAASAGRKHVLKEDAFLRQTQPLWTSFPPDARPSSRKDTELMLHEYGACLVEESHEAKRNHLVLKKLLLDDIRVKDRAKQAIGEVRRDWESTMLEVLQLSPDEELRQMCQGFLDSHYSNKRELDEAYRMAYRGYAQGHAGEAGGSS
ncbi:hypothetical protein EWM64_g6264 [Hericium alpestre]|uniref:Uncharacterized protein n=1 Tax=Hericium alpestre TaxID=135208 RepID=A0A4Y9ZUK1_9AGAM|nr:hypothetical protein EWM64_g6264 [Hericium alpestre]